jgi:hypothetical protein
MSQLEIRFVNLVGLGFELRAFHLQSRCSITVVSPPVYFALVILEMGSPELFVSAGLQQQSS